MCSHNEVSKSVHWLQYPFLGAVLTLFGVNLKNIIRSYGVRILFFEERSTLCLIAKS